MHSTRPTDSSMGVVHCDIKPQNILATLHIDIKLARRRLPRERINVVGHCPVSIMPLLGLFFRRLGRQSDPLLDFLIQEMI